MALSEGTYPADRSTYGFILRNAFPRKLIGERCNEKLPSTPLREQKTCAPQPPRKRNLVIQKPYVSLTRPATSIILEGSSFSSFIQILLGVGCKHGTGLGLWYQLVCFCLHKFCNLFSISCLSEDVLVCLFCLVGISPLLLKQYMSSQSMYMSFFAKKGSIWIRIKHWGV